MFIREATPEDWPAMWPFMQRIVAAGRTFSYDLDLTADEARRMWLSGPSGRTVVAIEPRGAILGTAKMGPNHGGNAAHVATASFMVDPDHERTGVGRALGEHVLEWARGEGYRAMQFNAVVETNTGAVVLWRALGFEVLATVPEGFHHPEDGYVGLHIMHRRL